MTPQEAMLEVRRMAEARMLEYDHMRARSRGIIRRTPEVIVLTPYPSMWRDVVHAMRRMGVDVIVQRSMGV